MQNYIEQALRTKSDKFYDDKVPLVDFRMAVQECISACRALDTIKKTLFYGKPYTTGGTYKPNAKVVRDLIAQQLDEGSEGNEHEQQAVDIIHCIIGKATEAGELLELLIGDGFDSVNFIEEIGDSQWYDAIGLAAVGSTFADCQGINIAKLRARFPEKFTENDANNRDLEAERRTLETSPGLEQK